MNIEQQEHRICEIIRRVCEQNDVGVTFSTEPASATGATVVCAQYDLGRARTRALRRRTRNMIWSYALLVVMFVVVVSWMNVYNGVVLGLCAAWFGSSLHDCLRGTLPPPVSRHALDQEIAYALSADGHSVIKGADKTEIYFPDES